MVIHAAPVQDKAGVENDAQSLPVGVGTGCAVTGPAILIALLIATPARATRRLFLFARNGTC
jgi:hypothetical protein